MDKYRTECGNYTLEVEKTDRGIYINEFVGGDLSGTSGPWNEDKAQMKLQKILKFYKNEGMELIKVQ